VKRLEDIEGGDSSASRFALPPTVNCRGLAPRSGSGASTLYRKLKELGLDDGAPESADVAA
jgi:hypothetical protein